MKNKIALAIMALGLTLPAVHLNAQDGPRPPRGPRADGSRPPIPPLVAALDLNHDGVIDASELTAATQSLKALDKNHDGQLTADELRPARPAGAPSDQPDHPRPPRDQAANPDGKGGPPPGEAGGRRPGPPLVAALDTNHDGVIDATELANATASLKALDKNGDGQLNMDEIHPRGARGPRGPHGSQGDRLGNGQPEPADAPQQ